MTVPRAAAGVWDESLKCITTRETASSEVSKSRQEERQSLYGQSTSWCCLKLLELGRWYPGSSSTPHSPLFRSAPSRECYRVTDPTPVWTSPGGVFLLGLGFPLKAGVTQDKNVVLHRGEVPFRGVTVKWIRHVIPRSGIGPIPWVRGSQDRSGGDTIIFKIGRLFSSPPLGVLQSRRLYQVTGHVMRSPPVGVTSPRSNPGVLLPLPGVHLRGEVPIRGGVLGREPYNLPSHVIRSSHVGSSLPPIKSGVLLPLLDIP